MRVLLTLAVIVAGVYGLHRLALWAERRGWIYYRERRGSGVSVGNALLQVHALLEPAQRHVVEERMRDLEEDDESGEPPGGPPDGSPVRGRLQVDLTKE
jgi:hypothetical protein